MSLAARTKLSFRDRCLFEHGFVQLLSTRFPLPARSPPLWQRSVSVHPIEEGLGDQPSYFFAACAIAGLRVPNSPEACLAYLGVGAPRAAASAASHPGLLRELAAAAVWASAALVTLKGADQQPDIWLPPAAFPALQALVPEAASSWEWDAGLGLGLFWSHFFRDWKESGPPQHFPSLNLRIVRQDEQKGPPRARTGAKRPFSVLECDDPGPGPPLPPPPQPQGGFPGAPTLALHNVRVLLSTNAALVAERDAAVFGAVAIAAQMGSTLEQLRRSSASGANSYRLLESARERISALENNLSDTQLVLASHEEALHAARNKTEQQLQSSLSYLGRLRTAEGQIQDLRNELSSVQTIRARLEGEVGRLEADRVSAERRAQELLEASHSLSQDEHTEQVAAMQTEIVELRERVASMQRELEAYESDDGSAASSGREEGSSAAQPPFSPDHIPAPSQWEWNRTQFPDPEAGL